MKQEEDVPLSYKYRFDGGKFNSYFFQTDNEIVYEVKFKPTDYLFGKDSVFSRMTFELVIELKTTNIKLPLDKLIPYTIASIFDNFFTQNDYNIVVYLYESSDSRQDARRRKFDTWFGYFKKHSYYKFELMFSDESGLQYFTSMIIKSDNPHRKQLVNNFAEVMTDNNK